MISVYANVISICANVFFVYLGTDSYLDNRIDNNNDRFDRVYEIMIDQQRQISSNQSKIDMLTKQIEQELGKCVHSEVLIIRQTSHR